MKKQTIFSNTVLFITLFAQASSCLQAMHPNKRRKFSKKNDSQRENPIEKRISRIKLAIKIVESELKNDFIKKRYLVPQKKLDCFIESIYHHALEKESFKKIKFKKELASIHIRRNRVSKYIYTDHLDNAIEQRLKLLKKLDRDGVRLKTIKKIIYHHIDHWVNSIKNDWLESYEKKRTK